MARETQPILSSDTAINPGSSATVGVASGSIVSARQERAEIIVINDSANTVYLSLGGTAVVGSGVRLNANGGSFNSTAYRGAVAAIATGAGSNVTITEI